VFFWGGGGAKFSHHNSENPVQSVRGGFLEKMCKSRHFFFNVFLEVAKTKRDP